MEAENLNDPKTSALQQGDVRRMLRCIDQNVVGHGLTKNREYEIFTEQHNFVCIVDDNGKLKTYHRSFFDVEK